MNVSVVILTQLRLFDFLTARFRERAISWFFLHFHVIAFSVIVIVTLLNREKDIIKSEYI